MQILAFLHKSIFAKLESIDWLLAMLARLLFAALFFQYFWLAGITKLGDGPLGLFTPSANAYVQIFPRVMEAVHYDTALLTAYHTIIVLIATWAEMLLPILIVIGLFTRIAALGMIIFVAVQTLTDVYGHGLIDAPKELGFWFDKDPTALILDQRALWFFLLLVLVFKGAGYLSLDRALRTALP